MDRNVPSKPESTVSPFLRSSAYAFSPAALMMSQKPQAFNLRDLLVVLFKHKFKIVLVFLAAIIAAPLIYSRLPVIYEASSLLMIRYGREYSRPSIGSDPAPLRVGLPEIVNAEMSILTSRDLKEKVIGTVGVEKIFPTLAGSSPEMQNVMDIAIFMFDGMLSLQTGKNSNLINVSFAHRDPEVSANVVNALVDAYKDKRLEILKDSKSLPFLEKKTAEYRRKLDESEANLAALKQKYKVFSFDQQRNLVLTQRMQLDATSKTTQTQVKELTQKVSSLETQLKSVSQNITLPQEESHGVSEAELQLLTLERKEQELLSKYNESNGLVLGTRNEIRLVKDFLEKQKRKKTGQVKPGGNEFYQSLQKDIITAKAELGSLAIRSSDLQQQLAEIDRNMQALDLQEKDVRDLERQVSISEQNYQTYLKKLEEARISDDMDQQEMNSVSVVQSASAPLVPKSPSKGLLQYLGIAALLGAAGGVGLAFFLEFIKQGLISPQRAEKCLGLPVLTTISHRKRAA